MVESQEMQNRGVEIANVDRQRVIFVKRYYGMEWPTRELYHLMINSKVGDDIVIDTILNEIVDDPNGDLALKFTFTLTIENVAAGSAEEKEFAAQMEDGYLMAVRATLKAMRKLAAEKAPPAASA